MARIAELDALRGIAAMVIVLFHLKFVERFPLWQSAVDLFFVLSGYLITTILLRARGTPGALRTFYVRRSLRIWPAYYLALLLVLLVNPLLGSPDPLEGLGQYATYTQFIQRYWGGEPPSFSRLFVHTWTLAIEEQFYVVWPLVVLLFGRAGVGLGGAVLAVLPVVLRAQGYHRGLLFTRSEGLALGAILALLMLSDLARTRRRWLSSGHVVLGLAMLSVPLWREAAVGMWGSVTGGAVSDPWLASLQITRLNVLYFALVGFLLPHVGHPLLGFLRGKRLVGLGRISYGLYLYHPIAFALVMLLHRQVPIGGSTLWDILKVAAAVGLAAVSWRLIERPILEWKEGLSLARSAGLETGGEALRGPHFGGPAQADRVERERAGGTRVRG